jgi:hypothetical protein
MKCDNCRLLFCDIISSECVLKPNEVAKVRPDLIKSLTHYRAYKATNDAACKNWRERHPKKRRRIQRDQWAKHKDAINARRRLKRHLSGAICEPSPEQVTRTYSVKGNRNNDLTFELE